MNIYLDLDDTLIHSVFGGQRAPGSRTPIRLSDDEVYHSLLRPEAWRILAGLRSIGRVQMLTTATDEYARAHNKAFSLGFGEDEIIARESYTTKVQLAYGSDVMLTATRTDPGAVLVDNLEFTTESSRTKCAFLGIGEDGYFQIREFAGKDPECFGLEVDGILKSIASRARGENAEGGGHATALPAMSESVRAKGRGDFAGREGR